MSNTQLADEHDDNLPKKPEHDASVSLIQVIERASNNPDTDIEKMERLMQMYERIESKKAEKAFSAAMTLAQSQVGRVATDASNSQTHSHYATYAALDRVMRPIYVQAGFSLSFDTEESTKYECVRVVCFVSHRDGYTRKHHVDMPADGKGAKGNDVMTKTHATGSATQYGMRYLLKMIFNIAIGSDDDGNGASPQFVPVTAEQEKSLHYELDKLPKDLQDRFYNWAKVRSVSQVAQAAYSDCLAAIQKQTAKLEQSDE